MQRALKVMLIIALAALAACSPPPPNAAAPAPPIELAGAQDTSPGPEPDAEAPNIVVFMTDDQTVNEMVALDTVRTRIFAEGATFTNSIVNLPSCCPSRATFLTGQHATNHGVLANSGVSGGFSSFENQEATLPTALREQGYETVFVGKYLNGFGFTSDTRYTPPGWSDFRGLVAPTEVLYHSPSLWINGTMLTFGERDYTTDVLHEQTLDAVGSALNTQAPVFAWVSYPAPHAQAGAPLLNLERGTFLDELSEGGSLAFLAPPLVAERHAGVFSQEALPVPPSLNEFDVDDKPEFLERRIRVIDEMAEPTLFYRNALESLLAVDESIEGVMDLLAEQHNDRDTWFFFTSDNGLLLGQHRHFGTKYYAYEESARVPLGVTGPGVDPGSTFEMPVSNVDLAPTILELAKAKAPRPSDGLSLVPYLIGGEEQRGRALLIEGFDFRPSAPPYEAVHTGDSVYVAWATGERELYDLVLDPYQMSNVVDDPAASELLARNEALLAALVDCAGSACAEVGSDLPVPASSPLGIVGP